VRSEDLGMISACECLVVLIIPEPEPEPEPGTPPCRQPDMIKRLNAAIAAMPGR
jgi:hypothetical protein